MTISKMYGTAVIWSYTNVLLCLANLTTGYTRSSYPVFGANRIAELRRLSCCSVLLLINIYNSSFPVFLNCSRESREVPEFIVPTLIEKNTNFFG